MPSFVFGGKLVAISKGARQRWVRNALPALNAFARRAQRAAGVRGYVDVLLASDAEISELNQQYRGKKQTTDVLSFAAPGPEGGGDIAISTHRAEQQAREFSHEPSAEVKVLILHGMLHLAGFDHEHDRGEMAREEERLREQLGLENSLIMRAKRPTKYK